jgi:flagellar basal body rod protein FlgC
VRGLFYNAESIHDAGVENWNVSQVWYMAHMFSEAKAFNANLSAFGISMIYQI